jgi:cytochrome c oxidase subunit IV
MTDTIADKATSPYRSYWITWIILLAITVGMLMAEEFHLPKWFLLLFLLSFMAVKAVMIAGNFMHLRHEQRNLAVMVAAGIVVTSLILYTYVSFETGHILERTVR